MAAKEPIIIMSSSSKIYNPKPKRKNKKYNIYQYNKKCVYNNRQLKTRKIMSDFNYENKKNCIKNYFYEDKNKALSFNLDLISLEEINKDFKEFKSKSEELEVQNELVSLIKEADNEHYREDFHLIKRPENPSCTNIK